MKRLLVNDFFCRSIFHGSRSRKQFNDQIWVFTQLFPDAPIQTIPIWSCVPDVKEIGASTIPVPRLFEVEIDKHVAADKVVLQVALIVADLFDEEINFVAVPGCL